MEALALSNLSYFKRRSYLLRGKHLSYTLSWCLLPIGLFLSWFFYLSQGWKALIITLIMCVIPGLICFYSSHKRFFWSKSKQNKFIRKCLEDDRNKSVIDSSPTISAKHSNDEKITSSYHNKSINSTISDIGDSIGLSPGQKKAAEFAATYAALKTVRKATDDFGINIASNSNSEKYKQSIRMPGQRPSGNVCLDCRYANYKDKDHIICKKDGFNRIWGNNTPGCQRFIPKK